MRRKALTLQGVIGILKKTSDKLDFLGDQKADLDAIRNFKGSLKIAEEMGQTVIGLFDTLLRADLSQLDRGNRYLVLARTADFARKAKKYLKKKNPAEKAFCLSLMLNRHFDKTGESDLKRLIDSLADKA